MQVELIELVEGRARFLLRGVTPAFANAIRRACLAEVPSLAIDEISIYDNTSVLFDEQLSLRLGLVPIKADDLSLFRVPEECECGGAGCPACQVGMTLSAEGPCTVHSGDLRFSDPGVKVVFEKIPIAILGEGEKLMLEGIVTLNRGTVHAKWQAGTQCGYKNLPEITISDRCEGCGKCVEVCPRKVLVIGEGEGKVRVHDPISCSLCKLCIGECDVGAINVSAVEDVFVMKIDTDGSMPAKDLVTGAAGEIRRRATSLSQQLSDLA
ncbi:DNA-directed RNA polymerase subunit D [Methanothrix harundinacea]|uniref:DNA-directed RNA polymerase subunit Rpo3 n=1 Tax=Methanothrix harundinacea (strain 6Ac) TaxID=1110509 RepID=G7WKZ9_METH6|nr:DNA-directed RNA polymerase subunit D [Methanothrix harundinacea]AET64182.1 DNA-directed RNA polymerase subunit D [Methanothrix harundinacea 6Ac]